MILRKANLGTLQDTSEVVLEVFEHHEDILRDLALLCVVRDISQPEEAKKIISKNHKVIHDE